MSRRSQFRQTSA